MSEDGRDPGISSAIRGVPVGDLAALLARVEGAEGPSEEIDALILCALAAPPGSFVEQSKINGAWCVYKAPDRLWERSSRDGWWRREGWPVTASIDAALGLCERVLGGDGPHTVDLLEVAIQTMCVRGWRPNQPLAPQLAIAVIREMLEALIAQAASPASGHLHRLDEPNPSPLEPSAGWRGNSSSQSQPSDRRADALSVGLDAEPSAAARAYRHDLHCNTDGSKPKWAEHTGCSCHIRSASSGEIYDEAARVSALLDQMFAPDPETGEPFEGHSGSPGEWMVERLDEIDTELKRRAAAARPTGDSDGGPGKPNETGELEEHKALSPLEGGTGISSVAESESTPASPVKSDSQEGH